MEKRFANVGSVAGRKITGYAATFDHTADLGRFKERIKPGAFTRSLGKDILCLMDHDAGKVLGRTKSGTLRLTEDASGLKYELDLPDTTTGRDLVEMATRGDLGGMSFGFTVPKDGQEWISDTRILTAVDLVEISVVSAHPAYEGTSVALRSKARKNKIQRFLETI
jgi:HK97 family phage prohead protease